MRTPPRRWIAAAGALLVSVGSIAVGGTTADAVPGPGQVELTFLNINDFHGRIEAASATASGITTRLALLIEQQRAAAGETNTVLLSAGDNIGATLFASAVAQDQPTIDVLNALDVVASAVGNHELDQGFADLQGRVIGGNGPNTPAEFPYLAANMYDTATGDPVLEEYMTFDMAGLTVGVIGAITQETPTLVSPGGIVGLTFGDPVSAVNRVADQLTDGDGTNGEADILVAEYHEGAGAGVAEGATLEQEVAEGGAFASIVNDTSADVDMIFTGHSHKLYAWDGPVPGAPGRTRPIVQTGNYGDNIGRVVLTVDETTGDVASYTATNLAMLANTPTLVDAATLAAYPRVASVKAIADAAGAAAAVVGDQPVGSVTADITTAFAGGTYTGGVYTGGTRDDRAKESTLGDLVADSMVASLSDPLRGGATIGVVNPGGLRAELFYAADPLKPGIDADGRVLYAEANGVLPFVNNLWTLDLTGAQFKTMLEQQWQRTSTGTIPSRPYLQLGLSENVTYTFDPSLPEGSRITSIRIDGAPIDPAAIYRVGAFSFLALGGDNFHVFKQATDVRDSGLVDRDAWIQYVTDNSPLSPDVARQSVQVSPLPTTASVGQNLTFGVASLDLTSRGAPANTSVAVSLGGTSLGSVAVTDGAASIDLLVPPGTPTGVQDLVLVASPSNTTVTVPVTVADDRLVSTTTLTRSAASQVFGDPATVTLTATVALAGASTPSGSVEFVANGLVLASVPLVDGVASYTLASGTSAGTYLISARYADTNSVKGSESAALRVTVKKATSFTFLSPSMPVQHRNGTPVVLTARVVLTTPTAATGSVEFRVGGFVVATVPVSGGRATYTLPANLRVGRYTFTAKYLGAESIKPSVSNRITIRVVR